MRALVVDDEPINRLIIVEMLGSVHIEVREAPDAATGLQMLDRDRFDLVLMDVRMPGMDGFEAVRRIRAMPNDKAVVPVVMVTGDVTDDCFRLAEASGANSVVLKPVSLNDLLQTVALALSASSAAILD